MGAALLPTRYTMRPRMPEERVRYSDEAPVVLDQYGRPVDPRTIENVRQTRDDWIPPTSRVGYSTRTRGGVAMTPDRALTVSAAWACVRYLSTSIAALPWRVKRTTEKGSQVQPTHPVDYMVSRRTSPEWSSFQFRETMIHWALRWGNGFAEIERDQAGRPLYMWPIHPSRVLVMRDLRTQDLFYQVWSNRASFVWIDPADMFHVRAFGEGPVGLSIMAYAAESLGWAKAAQLFGSNFFGGGATATGVIKAKKAITKEQRDEIKREWRTSYGGRNAGGVVVLDVDMDYAPTTIDPNKAQFIETHQFLLDEVCRWFGVPPHKIYNLLRATFSNIEHQSIEVVIDSLKPWARRLQDEADYKLFGQNRQSYFTEIDFNEILRGDMAVRMQFYQGMRNIGALNVNEIREYENLNNIGPDGDKYTLQSGMTTLENIGAVGAPQLGADGTSPDATTGDGSGAPKEADAEPSRGINSPPLVPGQGPAPAKQDTGKAVKWHKIRAKEREFERVLAALQKGSKSDEPGTSAEPRKARQLEAAV